MSDSPVPLEGYAYIECRDLRHAWKVVGWYMGADDRMKRRCSCIRCGTVRNETVEGWVTRRSYDYPENYHLDHRPSIAEIRQEAASRAHVFKSELDLERSVRRKDKKVG